MVFKCHFSVIYRLLPQKYGRLVHVPVARQSQPNLRNAFSFHTQAATACTLQNWASSFGTISFHSHVRVVCQQPNNMLRIQRKGVL